MRKYACIKYRERFYSHKIYKTPFIVNKNGNQGVFKLIITIRAG